MDAILLLTWCSPFMVLLLSSTTWILLSDISGWHIYLCTSSFGVALQIDKCSAINNKLNMEVSILFSVLFSSSFVLARATGVRMVELLVWRRGKNPPQWSRLDGKYEFSLALHHFSCDSVRMCVFTKRYFNKNDDNIFLVLIFSVSPITRKYVKRTNNWHSCIVSCWWWWLG